MFDYPGRYTRTARAIVAVLVGCGVTVSGEANDRAFTNPYASVDWAETTPYYANLHTHTIYSDGSYAPHEVIDMYKDLGYHILALTDHDTDHVAARPEILYPWTELDRIYEAVKDRPNISWRWSDRKYKTLSEPWESRNPDELGMISVPGTEISRTHHIASLFCLYAGHTACEETAIAKTGKHDGLAVMLHPGRYDYYPAWYGYFYERFDHLIAMEVFNQNDRHPEDRAMWDRVLHRLMPDRPVWGMAGDDMHDKEHLGWNYNIIPLPELTKAGVRNALKTGAYYFYRPQQQMTGPSLHITDLDFTNERIRLTVSGEIAAIQWITHNPETGQSETISEGPHLEIADVPASAVFVRARIHGANGTAYTQPFGIRTPEPRERPVTPPGDLQALEGWRIYQDNNATLTLDESEDAIQLTYDLADGRWVAIVKDLDHITKDMVIRFDVRGEGAAISIEVKLEDGGGATYGQTLPMKSDHTSWYAIDIAVTDMKYWWGGKEALDLSRVALSFAIAQKGGDPGGAGIVHIANISIR